MRTVQAIELPAPLRRVRQRFEQWRKTRKPRSRIPGSLWAAAVQVAGKYGLHRTARAIPVEYYSLKKRLKQQSAAEPGIPEPDPAVGFVEFPATSIGVCDCTLELEDRAGSKMRVHLKAASPPDLAALCQSFWNPAS
jgi:hypothetical protein